MITIFMKYKYEKLPGENINYIVKLLILICMKYFCNVTT